MDIKDTGDPGLAAAAIVRSHKLVTRFLPAYGLLLPASCFLAFLAVATGFLLRYSFNGWDPGRGMYTAWTVANYFAFFSDGYTRSVFLDTVEIALVVTAFAVLLGYPVAYVLSISQGMARRLFFVLIISPLLIDVLVRAYGWLVLLSNNGLVNVAMVSIGIRDEPVQLLFTPLSVIAELLHETLPMMILPIAAVLQKIDPALKDASYSLGANKLQTFLRVTLPLSAPGILAGTLLVFALSMSAFVAPLVLGAGKVPMMSLLIRDQMSVLLNWPLAAAESIILVGLTLALMYLYTRVMGLGAHSSEIR